MKSQIMSWLAHLSERFAPVVEVSQGTTQLGAGPFTYLKKRTKAATLNPTAESIIALS